MAFDYLGAINAGYTPDEISEELKNRGVDMDLSGAIKAGYSDDEIAKELDNRFNSKSSVPPRPADFVDYQEEQKPKEQPKEEGIIDKVGHFVQMPSQALQEALSRNPSDTISDVVKGAIQANNVNNAFYAGVIMPAGNIATNIYNQATDSNAQNPVQTYREDQQQKARAIEQEALKNGQPSASYELGNILGDYNNLAFGAGGAGKKIAAENLAKEYGRKAVEGGVIGSGFGAGKSVGMDEPLSAKYILEGGATLAILNPLLHGITQSYSRGLKVAEGMGLKGNDAIDFATRTAQDEAIAKTFNEQTKSIADTIDQKLVDMGEKPHFKEEVKPTLNAEEVTLADDMAKQNNISIEEATRIFEEAKNNEVEQTPMFSKSRDDFKRISPTEYKPYDGHTDLLARERFNIPELEQISKGGSDRMVMGLNDDMVLKVAKKDRGLQQNEVENEPMLNGNLLPQVYESGKNYVVQEKIDFTKNRKEINNFTKFISDNIRSEVYKKYPDMGKIQAVFEDAENKFNIKGLSDLANYEPLWNDVMAARNWGIGKDGRIVLADGGSISKHILKVEDYTKDDWKQYQQEIKSLKKEYGDTDSYKFSKNKKQGYTTKAQAEELAKKTLGKQYDKLKDDINIVQKYEDLPQDLQDRGEQFSSGGKVRGVFDPQDGKVHLIADSMDAKEVPSVVVHELLHKSIASGAKPLGEAHDTFVLRLKQLKDEPLVKEAFQSVKDAGTLDKHVNEEMMSYLVEKYQLGKDMSPRLKRFVSDVIDKVKVFASETAVKLGVDAKWLVSKMNEKDIASILKASAIRDSLKSGTKKDVMFSKAKEAIKEIPNSDQPKLVQEAIKKAIHKNMIEGTLDKGIQKIVGGAMKLADAVTAHKITKAYDKVMDTQFMDNMFGHKIYKAADYMELRDTTLQNMNKMMSKAMDMHNLLKDLSMQAREAMYDYATGDKSVQLTPELKKATDTMIKMVDDAGKKLVENGTLSKEAYEEWQGQYLHRKYISKLKNAQDLLYKSGGGFKTEEIKARGKIWEGTPEELKTLQDNGEIGKISEGKIEATELPNGKISLRRDWTKEERAKMGEIRDIAFAFPETYGRLAMLAEHGKLLASVPEKYIAKEGKFTDSQLKDFGYKKLDGKKFGALNGRWVSNTIADDIHRTATELNGDETMKAYKEYVSMLKASHTIYNTSSHVNNLLSNVVMQFTAGLNPAKAIVYAVQGAKTLKEATRLQELNAKELTGLSHNETKEIQKLKADKNVSMMVEAQELGLFGRSQLNSILRTYLSPTVDVGNSGKLAKVKEAFSKAYEGEDNMMRFSAFKQLREQGMSAKEAVTKINNDIVPDYSKPMSKYARNLRDSGFVPFMSWIYYSTPMIVRQLKQSPSRTIALMAGIYAIDNAFGINPYDAKDMPQDGFAKDNIVIGRTGNKVDVMRISSILPQANLLSPVGTVKGMVTGGIPQTVAAALFNMDLYNMRPVTQASGGKAVYQYSKNLIQNALPTPDTADRAYNLAESHILPARVRKSNEVIEPRTPMQEAASFLVNTKTYDKSKQREKAINDKLKDKK